MTIVIVSMQLTLSFADVHLCTQAEQAAPV